MYMINVYSHHFTVAGLLDFRYTIPTSQPLSIYSIRVYIMQHIHLHSLTNPSKNVCPLPQKVNIHTLDFARPPQSASHPPIVHPSSDSKGPTGGVLAVLKEGEEYEAKQLIRIPNDLILRPTTLPGSKTPFKISHDLCIETVFQIDGDEKKTMTIKRPLSPILSVSTSRVGLHSRL